MVNEKRNRCNRVSIDILAILFPLLAKLLVELDEEKGLILHVRKQIVLANKIEYVWTT